MTPIKHVETATAALSGLAWETQFSDGYAWPADVDAVISELATAALRIEKALAQAGRWLHQAEAAGEIGHDQDLDVGAAIEAVTERLTHAATASAGLYADLDAVHQITTHLTGTH